MQPEAIAARLWPGRTVALESLGGMTGRNVKATVDGDEYVLRFGGRDAALLGIDRRAEQEASAIAAGLGVAPEVVAFVEPEGVVVTRFVRGRPVDPEQLREPSTVATLAHMLRRVHNTGSIGARFDPFRLVEAYGAEAARHGVATPPAYDRLCRTAGMVERLRPPHPQVMCHNDLVNANLIEDEDDRIWVVDWEYAGMGDRFFDLANLAANHGFGEAHDRMLLATYGVEDERSFVQMRFVSHLRHAMWGLVQQALSDAERDFAGYAAEHFARAEAAADSDRFRHAMI